MAFHLICTVPFHDHKTGRLINKGDMITEQEHVARHTHDREHHFIRIAAPDEPVAPPPEEKQP